MLIIKNCVVALLSTFQLPCPTTTTTNNTTNSSSGSSSNTNPHPHPHQADSNERLKGHSDRHFNGAARVGVGVGVVGVGENVKDEKSNLPPLAHFPALFDCAPLQGALEEISALLDISTSPTLLSAREISKKNARETQIKLQLEENIRGARARVREVKEKAQELLSTPFALEAWFPAAFKDSDVGTLWSRAMVR